MSSSLGLTREHEHLVVLSSGGCVFDSFGSNVRYAFIPAAVEIFELQKIRDTVREVFEWVYLLSPSRGVNRFPVLCEVFHELSVREDVKKAGVELPETTTLQEWIRDEPVLSAAKLEERILANDDPFLRRTLEWSAKVSELTPALIEESDPFQNVLQALNTVSGKADVAVFSAAPTDAEQTLWKRHHLDGWSNSILGREHGTKREILAKLLELGYDGSQVLTIGDRPGDLVAADSAHTLFFPILPEQEGRSWKRFVDEAWEPFLNGEFMMQQGFWLDEFAAALEEVPPWRVTEKK